MTEVTASCPQAEANGELKQSAEGTAALQAVAEVAGLLEAS